MTDQKILIIEKVRCDEKKPGENVRNILKKITAAGENPCSQTQNHWFPLSFCSDIFDLFHDMFDLFHENQGIVVLAKSFLARLAGQIS